MACINTNILTFFRLGDLVRCIKSFNFGVRGSISQV